MDPVERQLLISEIVAAVNAEAESALTADERRWVRLAIQREAQRAEVRTAVITKSLAGLAWSALVGLGIVLWNYAHNQFGRGG